MNRWLIAAFAVALSIALANACSSGNSCSSATCGGCCDSTGTCQMGTTNNACGVQGGACAVCPQGQGCQSGMCTASSGNTDSGTTCGPSNCTGCCASNNYCFPSATSNLVCGSNGGACASCSNGEQCIQGTCQTCTGCLDSNGNCQKGNTQGACGTGGGSCQGCLGNQTCTAGQCVASCTGCIGGDGGCQTGDTTGACGSGGNNCQVCSAGQSCTANSCSGGSCSGECVGADGGCQTGTSTSACGTSGANCAVCLTGETCTNGLCACSGCIDTGGCEVGTATTACGTGGASCQVCTTGQACTASGCQATQACSGSTCPAGCCNAAGTCVTAETSAACGNTGTVCAVCSGGTACTSSGCTFTGDGGFPAGTVTVLGAGYPFPPSWTPSSAALLKSDNSGVGASTYVGSRVVLTGTLTTSNSPCPEPYTLDGGKTYCDAANFKDSSGNTVIVDTFSFLGSAPACSAALPTYTSGSTQNYTSVAGIWEDDYSKQVTPNDQFVIALTQCADLTPAPAGSTAGYAPSPDAGTPPPTTDVHNLLMNFTAGVQVGTTTMPLRGIVVGVWASKTAWGFTMQDPAGGPWSAIAVERGSTSTSTSVVPALGNYVTVLNASTTQEGGKYPELHL
jgi:hypothetical protein